MYDETLKLKEKIFNNFLNKTIIFSSKKYYKEVISKDFKELKIIDDENYSEYIKQYISYEGEIYNHENIGQFIEDCDNILLVHALKSLSSIEMTVIFLLFEKQLTSSESAEILKICSDSVTRIKRRALKKIRKYLKGGI